MTWNLRDFICECGNPGAHANYEYGPRFARCSECQCRYLQKIFDDERERTIEIYQELNYGEVFGDTVPMVVDVHAWARSRIRELAARKETNIRGATPYSVVIDELDDKPVESGAGILALYPDATEAASGPVQDIVVCVDDGWHDDD